MLQTLPAYFVQTVFISPSFSCRNKILRQQGVYHQQIREEIENDTIKGFLLMFANHCLGKYMSSGTSQTFRNKTMCVAGCVSLPQSKEPTFSMVTLHYPLICHFSWKENFIDQIQDLVANHAQCWMNTLNDCYHVGAELAMQDFALINAKNRQSCF